MPRSLIVRKLDEELVARLKRRAAAHGRSAEAEHRDILRLALAGEGGALPAGENQRREQREDLDER